MLFFREMAQMVIKSSDLQYGTWGRTSQYPQCSTSTFTELFSPGLCPTSLLASIRAWKSRMSLVRSVAQQGRGEYCHSLKREGQTKARSEGLSAPIYHLF